MVAAVSTVLNPKTTGQGVPHRTNHPSPRAPLLPSESENAFTPRRPRSREVTSRYLSSSSNSNSTPVSRRCQSPLVSRTANSTPVAMTPMPSAQATIKTSQLVERKLSTTPRRTILNSSIRNGSGGCEAPSAQKMLFTSARSLSVSFQGESFSVPFSKVKPAPPQSARKATPERTKGMTPARREGSQVQNPKLLDQRLWPGRIHHVNSMTRSVDFADERKRVGGSGNVVRALQSSSFDGRMSEALSNAQLGKVVKPIVDGNSAIGSNVQCDPITSDTESVSSAGTSGAHESVNGGRGSRGVMVPARFLQERNNRLHHLPESIGLRTTATSKLIVPNKFSNDSLVCSPREVLNSRGRSSPIRGEVKPASPNKLIALSTSLLRGTSPSRMRNMSASTHSSYCSSKPSILSFAADVRNGKIGENQIADAHLLRLLHNRFMQWRFVNARSEVSLALKKMNAEKLLYNALINISKVREAVKAKRIKLQSVMLNLKIASILKDQMMSLEGWARIDDDFSSSLLGAREALHASTIRLPLVAGARADAQKLNVAICSAVDVMQSMASSIHSLFPKVDELNYLLAEITNATAMEQALLNQCTGLLSTVTSLQVKDFSLRTHILQLRRMPSA